MDGTFSATLRLCAKKYLFVTVLILNAYKGSEEKPERMQMYNPFMEKHDSDGQDQDMINKALKGGSADLENLILRHQAWIYNIALGMTCDASEAEDITQEILIKMITSLSTYDRTKAAFRTWLYRIVANHVLSQRRGRKEEAFSSLVTGEAYHEYVESIPGMGVPGKN
jgi:hypothetical protein